MWVRLSAPDFAAAINGTPGHTTANRAEDGAHQFRTAGGNHIAQHGANTPPTQPASIPAVARPKIILNMANIS